MSVYDEFFDLNRPCPESILDCDKLREQYKQKKDDFFPDGKCSGCQAVNIKMQFMTEVWKAYIAKLNLNA
jgi:hypothetical protein